MENQNEFQPQPNFNMQIPLPNASAILVLGIISIVGCCLYGAPGLICGIIALALAGKDMKLYTANPNGYTPGSLSNLRSGKVCAIIGLSLSILHVLFWVFVVLSIGFAGLSDPQHFIDHLNH